MAAEPRDGPAEEARQRGHADRRSKSKQEHVCELRRRGGQRGQHERGERAAACQSVDRTDEERPAGERPASDVDVRRRSGVLVNDPAVPVDMRRSRLPLTRFRD